jgi:hypothetical protein
MQRGLRCAALGLGAQRANAEMSWAGGAAACSCGSRGYGAGASLSAWASQGKVAGAVHAGKEAQAARFTELGAAAKSGRVENAVAKAKIQVGASLDSRVPCCQQCCLTESDGTVSEPKESTVGQHTHAQTHSRPRTALSA